MMDSNKLRKKFLDFFEKEGHTIISPASLIPENDPTALFTSAGMQPLVPFLMGEKHPRGKRLVNIQPCVRTDDIDEVGDKTHHTFFEMMGSWSLGDYFKQESISLSLEFLTSSKWLGLKMDNLAVSIFKGDDDAPKDEESRKIWIELGLPEKRIAELSKKDNWWGPVGDTGPCGPDTEIFYWAGSSPAPADFDSEDDRWVEIWNNVFMEYNKSKDGYSPLFQKNVDTGMGFERILSVLNGLDDDYQTDLFSPIIKKIEKLSGKKYKDNEKEFRVIADHLKAVVFIVGDKKGVEPSNTGQGYIVRRLLRRAIYFGKYKLDMSIDSLVQTVKEVFKIYKDVYPEIKGREDFITDVIKKEESIFDISKGEKSYKKTIEKGYITGEEMFSISSTSGTPVGVLDDWVERDGIEIREREGIEIAFKKHQDLSRTASAGMFKGGLVEGGEQSIKYHTATHLLLAALREVLGDHVLQKGSHITEERLRFDFSHPEKLTDEEKKKVENLVNERIKENIPVECKEVSLEEAKKENAMGVFESKYEDKVKVYTIGEFSKEICGGPHVSRTGELGEFKIKKEESSSAGVRRIKAVLK